MATTFYHQWYQIPSAFMTLHRRNRKLGMSLYEYKFYVDILSKATKSWT
jgi:hypothetical protein